MERRELERSTTRSENSFLLSFLLFRRIALVRGDCIPTRVNPAEFPHPHPPRILLLRSSISPFFLRRPERDVVVAGPFARGTSSRARPVPSRALLLVVPSSSRRGIAQRSSFLLRRGFCNLVEEHRRLRSRIESRPSRRNAFFSTATADGGNRDGPSTRPVRDGIPGGLFALVPSRPSPSFAVSPTRRVAQRSELHLVNFSSSPR